ncbi:MAG: hypothetical protein U9Q67_03295, partial [Patescibacteria group bacterium]|nr:hypothetical protein [Patescibacteria group bacterium]
NIMDFNNPKESNSIFADNPPGTPPSATPPPPPQQPSQMNVPPSSFRPEVTKSKPKRKGLFIFLGVFLGLAVLLGGGYFAWDRGYISIPFLPPSINRVIAAMVTELSDVNQARYQQTITIKVENRPADAVPLNLSSDNQNEDDGALAFLSDDYLGDYFGSDFDLELTTEGIYRSGADTSLNTELKISGHFAGFLSAETINFGGEIRMIDDYWYFMIKELPSIYVDMLSISSFMDKWIQVEFKNQEVEKESDREMEQFFEMVTTASQYELIKIQETVDGGTIDGHQTNQVTLSFDPTQLKTWYEQTVINLEEKFGDKTILQYDEEMLQNFDEARYQELFNYLKDNLEVNIWLDKDSYLPRKMSFAIGIVPPDSVTSLANKQIKISFSMQLTNINEEVVIEEPTEYITFEQAMDKVESGESYDYDKDTDGDGLTDYEETTIFKTDPTKKDTDGDGFDDKTEIKNGFNPNGEGKITVGPQTKARDAKRISDIRMTQSALELYYNNQTKPSYPTDGVAGANGTTDIGVLLTSITEHMPVAPIPPDGGCSADQNSYTYTSFSDAAHQIACDEQPCAYYTISYCLGVETGGIKAGPHTACERGIACETQENVNINLNQNFDSKERDAKRVSDVKQIQSALELFYNNQVTPSYPTDGVAGANGTTDIGVLLTSITEHMPVAPIPPDGGCSADQNSYTYTSFSDAAHQIACDEQPCAHYTISYCLGGTTGGIEAGAHTACETGIACET